MPPKKIFIKKDESISICSCGQSKNIPYCDNSHKDFNEKNKTSYKSVKIISHNDNEVEIFSSNWVNE